MKKINRLILTIGLFTSAASFGQVYVDGVAIDTLTTPYCQLICSNATIFTRTNIIIDHGQRFTDYGLNRQKIAGPDKQVITFNSTINALNFMAKHGWEVLSFQVTSTESGSDGKYVYLLQRRKKPQVTD